MGFTYHIVFAPSYTLKEMYFMWYVPLTCITLLCFIFLCCGKVYFFIFSLQLVSTCLALKWYMLRHVLYRRSRVIRYIVLHYIFLHTQFIVTCVTILVSQGLLCVCVCLHDLYIYICVFITLFDSVECLIKISICIGMCVSSKCTRLPSHFQVSFSFLVGAVEPYSFHSFRYVTYHQYHLTVRSYMLFRVRATM